MVMLQRTRLYKILTRKDWARAQQLGFTQTVLDEGDGFVHLSGRGQVAETLCLHYRRVKATQLLEFVEETLTGRLVWEPSRGGQSFPHLYGKLFISESVRNWTLDLDADGLPQLPKDIDACI